MFDGLRYWNRFNGEPWWENFSWRTKLKWRLRMLLPPVRMKAEYGPPPSGVTDIADVMDRTCVVDPHGKHNIRDGRCTLCGEEWK